MKLKLLMNSNYLNKSKMKLTWWNLILQGFEYGHTSHPRNVVALSKSPPLWWKPPSPRKVTGISSDLLETGKSSPFFAISRCIMDMPISFFGSLKIWSFGTPTWGRWVAWCNCLCTCWLEPLIGAKHPMLGKERERERERQTFVLWPPLPCWCSHIFFCLVVVWKVQHWNTKVVPMSSRS